MLYNIQHCTTLTHLCMCERCSFSLPDIDECAAGMNDCHAQASCMNTADGGYTCTCNTGYTGSGQECSGKQLFVKFTS